MISTYGEIWFYLSQWFIPIRETVPLDYRSTYSSVTGLKGPEVNWLSNMVHTKPRSGSGEQLLCSTTIPVACCASITYYLPNTVQSSNNGFKLGHIRVCLVNVIVSLIDFIWKLQNIPPKMI